MQQRTQHTESGAEQSRLSTTKSTGRTWWWHDDSYYPGPDEYEYEALPPHSGPTVFPSDVQATGQIIGIPMSRYTERDPWALVHVFEFTKRDMLIRDIPKYGDHLVLAGLDFGLVTQVHYTNDALSGHEQWDVTTKMRLNEAEELERQMFPLLKYPARLPPVTPPPPAPVYRADKDGNTTLLGYVKDIDGDKATVMTSGYFVNADGKITPMSHGGNTFTLSIETGDST